MNTTSLVLTEKQEANLLEYVEKRLQSLEDDNRDRILNDKHSWSVYHNERQDREQPDTIFEKSNVSVPLTTLVVDHFVTRAEDDITGQTPYVKFDAQGASDMKQAQDFDRYFNWKLETKGKNRRILEDAYLQAFVQRAAILKATYKEDVAEYTDREARVLYEMGSPEPILLEGIGMIIEGENEFIQIMNPALNMPQMVLQEDPSFVFDPSRHEFREYTKGIDMQTVRYKGPKTALVDYDRFFAPSDVVSLEEADFIAEKYDKNWDWVENMFLNRGFYSVGEYKKMVKDKSTAEPKTEGYREQEYRENLAFDRDDPKLEIVECWIKRDVLGKGYPQEFCFFYDPMCKKAIYYEYVQKITPDKRIPYSVVSINRDRNRWWGPSLPERIHTFQEFIDKQFNSQAFRNEISANPILGANPQALEEEPDDIEIHAGKVFTLKDNYRMQDFLSAVEIPNLDLKTQSLIDFVFSVVQLWLGVSNLAQGDMQVLQPATTATGVEATLREASKIGRRWLRRIVEQFEEHITKLVSIECATLDQREVYEYMEGDIRTFAEMKPRDLENLSTNVTIEVSQEQGQRQIERADLALKSMDRYFAYPPEMRQFVKPMIKEIVKALGYENADEYLPDQAPDVPRDEEGQPNDKALQQQGASDAIRGMGNSNQTGANQYTEGSGA